MNDVMIEAFKDELEQIKQAGWFDRISDAASALTRSGSFGKSISGGGTGPAKTVGKAVKSESDRLAEEWLKKYIAKSNAHP